MRKPLPYWTWIALAVTGLLAISFFTLREPRYGGKYLTAWVDHLVADRYDNIVNANPEAMDAIRHIGSDAVPYLLKWIEWDRPLQSKLPSGRLGRLLAKIAPRYFAKDRTKYPRGYCAAAAFAAIGAARAPGAIEKLNFILNQTAWDESNSNAATALGFLAPESLPTLMANLTNQNPRVKSFAACGFCSVGTNGRLALPLLLKCLDDPNKRFVGYVAYALGQMHSEPNVVVPALMLCLEQRNRDVRIQAMRALREFGRDGRPALTNLLAVLEDRDKDLVFYAVSALGKIQLEADLVVPALARCLRDRNGFVRKAAAISLGKFGQEARLPLVLTNLLTTLDDFDEDVATAATNALRQIDPQHLGRAQ
jgi:HEAT repeat protein